MLHCHSLGLPRVPSAMARPPWMSLVPWAAEWCSPIPWVLVAFPGSLNSSERQQDPSLNCCSQSLFSQG